MILIGNVVANIAVALGFLKGAELLLRAHQRKALQSFLEDMTLQMDNLEFRAISRRMGSQEAQYCFIILAYLEFTFVCVVNLVVQAPQWQPGGLLYEEYGQTGRYVQAGCIALSFITLGLCWRWPVPALTRWVIGTGRTWFVVLCRFVCFLAAGYAVFGLYTIMWIGITKALGNALDGWSVPSDRLFQYVGIPLVWPMFVVFWIITQAIGALLQARMFYVRWIFMLIRAALWRVVEYDKGAFAAIVLITTAVLTVLKEVLN